MSRFLSGILIGLLLAAPSSWALRIARPPEFSEWTTNTFTQLNQFLLEIWNVLNGRAQFDVTTTDPDGSRFGIAGECVYYDAATDQWCCNATGTQRAPTTVWRCVNLT